MRPQNKFVRSNERNKILTFSFPFSKKILTFAPCIAALYARQRATTYLRRYLRFVFDYLNVGNSDKSHRNKCRKDATGCVFTFP